MTEPTPSAAAVFARKHALQQAQRQLAASDALARVPRLAAACFEAGAARVWLFGSLVTGDWDSVDVDLAVAGIAPADLEPLWTTLAPLARPHRVDLVAFETAPALLQQAILAGQEWLHDAEILRIDHVADE